MMQAAIASSLSLEQVRLALDVFIDRSLDEFESRRRTFKQSLELIRSIFAQPSVRLQLGALAKFQTEEHGPAHEKFDPSSDSMKSKKLVQRLCQWLAVDATSFNDLTSEIELDRQNYFSKSQHLSNIELGKICLAAQLFRLWIFTQRQLHKLKAEGILTLSQESNFQQDSNESPKSCLQSESVCYLTSQLAGHIEIIVRTLTGTLTLIISKLRVEIARRSVSLEVIQSAVILTSIALAEALCHVIFWVISVPHSNLKVVGGGNERDPISNLRRAIPSLVSSACDVVDLSMKLGQIEKTETLLNRLCVVLTSPLLLPSTLRNVKPNVSTLFWNIALEHPKDYCRKVGRAVLCRLSLTPCSRVGTSLQGSSSNTWDELSKKAIEEGLEVTELLLSGKTLPDIVYASNRLCCIFDLLSEFMLYFGGTGITESLGHVPLESSSYVAGSIRLDNIIDVVARAIAVVTSYLRRLVAIQFSNRKRTKEISQRSSHVKRKKASNSLQSLKDRNLQGHNDQSSFSSHDHSLYTAEMLLAIEPLLENSINLLSTTLELVPTQSIVLRSPNISRILAEFCLALNKNVPLSPDTKELTLHTFFASPKNTLAIATMSATFLRFMAGSSVSDCCPFSPLHHSIFFELSSLSSSTLLSLLDHSAMINIALPILNNGVFNSIDVGITSLTGSSIQSHLQILEAIMVSYSFHLTPQLRAEIDECVLRLLWLTGQSSPSIRIPSAVLSNTSQALANLQITKALLTVIEASLLGKVLFQFTNFDFNTPLKVKLHQLPFTTSLRHKPSIRVAVQPLSFSISPSSLRSDSHTLPSAYVQAAAAIIGNLDAQLQGQHGIFGHRRSTDISEVLSLRQQLSSIVRKLKTQISNVSHEATAIVSSEKIEVLQTYSKVFLEQLRTVELDMKQIELAESDISSSVRFQKNNEKNCMNRSNDPQCTRVTEHTAKISTELNQSINQHSKKREDSDAEMSNYQDDNNTEMAFHDNSEFTGDESDIDEDSAIAEQTIEDLPSDQSSDEDTTFVDESAGNKQISNLVNSGAFFPIKAVVDGEHSEDLPTCPDSQGDLATASKPATKTVSAFGVAANRQSVDKSSNLYSRSQEFCESQPIIDKSFGYPTNSNGSRRTVSDVSLSIPITNRSSEIRTINSDAETFRAIEQPPSLPRAMNNPCSPLFRTVKGSLSELQLEPLICQTFGGERGQSTVLESADSVLSAIKNPSVVPADGSVESSLIRPDFGGSEDIEMTDTGKTLNAEDSDATVIYLDKCQGEEKDLDQYLQILDSKLPLEMEHSLLSTSLLPCVKETQKQAVEANRERDRKSVACNAPIEDEPFFLKHVSISLRKGFPAKPVVDTSPSQPSLCESITLPRTVDSRLTSRHSVSSLDCGISLIPAGRVSSTDGQQITQVEQNDIQIDHVLGPVDSEMDTREDNNTRLVKSPTRVKKYNDETSCNLEINEIINKEYTTDSAKTDGSNRSDGVYFEAEEEDETKAKSIPFKQQKTVRKVPVKNEAFEISQQNSTPSGGNNFQPTASAVEFVSLNSRSTNKKFADSSSESSEEPSFSLLNCYSDDDFSVPLNDSSTLSSKSKERATNRTSHPVNSDSNHSVDECHVINCNAISTTLQSDENDKRYIGSGITTLDSCRLIREMLPFDDPSHDEAFLDSIGL